MSIIKAKYFTVVILTFILIFSVWVRFFNLGTNPPALFWDEAAVSYNAWSIANFGVDEWGDKYPIYFKSFLDDKHPVHIYITAFFIKLFGISEFSVRFAPALFGVLNVLLDRKSVV